jgi:hypothetical protein
MVEQLISEEKRRIAEQVRAACLKAALDSYEQAGLSGLCLEGRWEIAVDAIQTLDLDAVLRDLVPEKATAQAAADSQVKA